MARRAVQWHARGQGCGAAPRRREYSDEEEESVEGMRDNPSYGAVAVSVTECGNMYEFQAALLREFQAGLGPSTGPRPHECERALGNPLDCKPEQGCPSKDYSMGSTALMQEQCAICSAATRSSGSQPGSLSSASLNTRTGMCTAVACLLRAWAAAGMQPR